MNFVTTHHFHHTLLIGCGGVYANLALDPAGVFELRVTRHGEGKGIQGDIKGDTNQTLAGQWHLHTPLELGPELESEDKDEGRDEDRDEGRDEDRDKGRDEDRDEGDSNIETHASKLQQGHLVLQATRLTTLGYGGRNAPNVRTKLSRTRLLCPVLVSRCVQVNWPGVVSACFEPRPKETAT
jgi:hypothetical protein